MKTIKRIFIVLALIVLAATPLFAEDGEWFLDRPINEIKYTGLHNVKEKTIASLLNSFVGKDFTYDLFNEVNEILYSQEWLDWMAADAEPAEDGWGVNLILDIHENTMVSSITTEGNLRVRRSSILEAQNIEVKSWYNSATLSANAQLVKNLYLGKGFLDVTVVPEVVLNEAANTCEIIYKVEEGKQYKISAILFEGISGLTNTEISKLLTSKRSSFFNSGNYVQSDVDADKKAIKAYYATKGYPYATILDVRMDYLEESSTEKTQYLNLVFCIQEGEVWTLSDITIEGNKVFSTSQLNEFINIHEGDLYNSDKINSIYTKIASLYYDNGYVYSSVSPYMAELEGNKMSIKFSITEGPQTVIEEIRINGLTKTKPYVMERELAVKVGDVFSRKNFIQSQQNMYNTSLLKDIKANIYPGKTENGLICEFTVEEGNQMELQFGATFGATEVNGFPISGFLSWNNNNLNGTAKKLGVTTNLSPTTQSLSVSLSDSWFKDKRWSNGISLSFERDIRSNALQQGLGSEAYDGRDKNQQTYPLGYDNAYQWYEVAGQTYPSESYLMNYDYYKLALGYTTGYTFVFSPGSLSVSSGFSVGLNRAVYDSTQFTPYERLIQKYNEAWQFSNKILLSLSWDGRVYTDTYPHGYVLSTSYTYAGGILGGLSNYNKVTLKASSYRGIMKFHDEEKEKDKNLILGFTSEANYMLPQYWDYDGDLSWHDAKNGATKYEMLYIDGMNIGRGFNVIYDQSFLFHNQIDLTYPWVEDVISAEGFVSATGLVSNLSDLNGLDSISWYMAAGFGIKMEIPGFPLGLYLVKNATYLPSDEGMNWTWQSGNLFSNGKTGSGMSLVLAITMGIY